MKTDALIALLSEVQAPVDRGRLERALAIAVAAGLVIATALVLMTVGAREDLAAALRRPPVWLKHGFTLFLLVVAALAYREALRPAAGEGRALWPAFAFAAIGLIAGVQLVLTAPAEWSALVFGQNWRYCLLYVPLYAAIPFAALIAAGRAGAPVKLRRAGALAGCLAGALGAAGYAIHCTDDTAPFLFVWYGLAILAVTLLGALMGPRLLRW